MYAQVGQELDTEIIGERMIEDNVIDLPTVDEDNLSWRRPTRGSATPKCLLTDSIRHEDGIGPVIDLDDFRGKLLVITLGISAVVERTGLTISIWGSSDGEHWEEQPLVTLRQRQYCGDYSALLNLARHPDVAFLRVHWTMSRWGRGERIAQFGFQVFAEESGARVSTSAYA